MKKRTFTPRSVLMGALLLALAAAMTLFVAERNLAYAQVNSDIATLSNLTVSQGTLTPGFDPNDLPSGNGNSADEAHAYTVNVRHSVSSLTVTATKTDSKASVAYIGGVGTSGTIDLAVGNNNVLTIEVTAEDTTTKKYYKVTVTRASSTASNDATLSALTVTPGMTTNPTTLGTKFAYSVDLPYDFDSDNSGVQKSVAIVATASQNTSPNVAVVTVKKGSKVIASTALNAVDMDVGDNTVTVDVLAPDFKTKKTYTLTINRARRNASDDARLSKLSLSNGDLMPAFDADDLPSGVGTSTDTAHAYTVSVPHSVYEVTVTAATKDSLAKWSVLNSDGSASLPDSNKTLSGHQVDVSSTSSATVFFVRASAEDRTTFKYYKVTVTRASVSASNDATLSALTLDTNGDPHAFTDLSEKFEHSRDLPYNIQDSDTNMVGVQGELVVTATQTSPAAVVTVKKGSKVINAADDGNYDVTISEGDNTVTVDVLAPDFKTKKTYTLTINRARSNASDDARLSDLSLSKGTLMPAFDAAKLPDNDNNSDNNTGDTAPGVSAANAHPYTARVPNSVDSLTVTAEAASSAAMVKITSNSDSSVSDGAVDLVVGANVIPIEVTAEDRDTKKYYRVTVTRAGSGASSDATLSALSVTPYAGTTPSDTAISLSGLDKKFEHTVNFTNTQDGADIAATATATATGAVVTIKKGSKVISSIDNADVAIDEGDNTITVDVLAPDYVATKTYTLTINRASGNSSDDATLIDLNLGDHDLMPAFDAANLAPGTTDNPGSTSDNPHLYTARVANSVDSLTVTAEAASSAAMVSITSNNDSSVSDGAVDLAVGPNVITIEVTAEDRATKKYYQVTVTRVLATASPNAALSSLVLEGTTGDTPPTVTLDPAWDTANLPDLVGGAHHFGASVPRGWEKIRVFPTAADTTGATVTVTPGKALRDDQNQLTGRYEVDLEVGDNVVTVMVTAANVASTKTFKITINRPGTGNAALSDLTLSTLSGDNIPLNEPFGTVDDDAYTANASSAESITITASAVQNNATVSITPDDNDSATNGHQVALNTVSNTITITVTAGDNTRTFTVVVTRPASTDATLASLMVGDMAIDLVDGKTDYTLEVTNEVDSVTVTATPSDSAATAVDDGGGDSLAVGENTVTITVTAEDGTTTMTYTVVITVIAVDPSLALFDEYDTNPKNNMIDKDEVVSAIEDYLGHGTLTKADVVTLIQKYLSGEPIRE